VSIGSQDELEKIQKRQAFQSFHRPLDFFKWLQFLRHF